MIVNYHASLGSEKIVIKVHLRLKAMELQYAIKVLNKEVLQKVNQRLR